MFDWNLDLLDNPLYTEEYLLKIRFSESITKLFNTIWESKELDDFIYNQWNLPAIKIQNSENENIKNMSALFLIFSRIPFLEKDDWVYVSCKDYLTFMVWLAIHTPWTHVNVSTSTINKILHWWIQDFCYAVGEKWKKLLDVLTNDNDKEERKLYLRLLEDAKYNYLKFYDNTNFDSNDFHIKLRGWESDFSKMTKEDKDKLIEMFSSYGSILYFENKATKSYEQRLNLDLREWFKEIVVKRDVIENENLLMATMYSLYSKNDLYLYYCPEILDMNITETKYISIKSYNSYYMINFSELIRSISHFDKTRELLREYMQEGIVKMDNIDDIKRLFDSLFNEITKFWADNIILNVKWIIDDKNRYEEASKILKRWNITMHKDNREKWHIEVSLQDSLKDQLKRDNKNLKSK